MRRRICLVATAVAAGSLLAGSAIASAAGTSATSGKHKKPKPTLLHCHTNLSTTPPDGSATVDQPPDQGNQYGSVNCPTDKFGNGVESDSFTVPDSGDTVGTYTKYFHNGTIKGSFDLTPDEAPPPTDTTFTYQSWTGTLTVTGGTGVYKGIKGKKATGVMTCTSQDEVHLTCTEHVKVLVPVATKTKKSH